MCSWSAFVVQPLNCKFDDTLFQDWGSYTLFHYIMDLYSFLLNHKINNKNNFPTINQNTCASHVKKHEHSLWLWYCHMFCRDLYSVYPWSVSLISASLLNGKKHGGGEKRLILILLINNLPVTGVHSVLPYTWAF